MDFEKHTCEIPGVKLYDAEEWLNENYPEMYCIMYKHFSPTVLVARLSTAKKSSLMINNTYTFGFANKETMVACKLKFG